ncbi:MAG: hypothetical protein QXU98_14360 [Candidatus Parvarchaeota archaeon]
MKLVISDACSRGHHGACTEDDCQCGCHYPKRHGMSPQKWKNYITKLRKIEEVLE